MNFTDKEWETLYKAHCEKVDLLVIACNGMGQEFSIIGKIAAVMGNEIPELNAEPNEMYAAVLDNCIVLDCGNRDEEAKNAYRTKYSAPMFTTLEKGSESLSNFFIRRIYTNKKGLKRLGIKEKLLYENPDYQQFKTLGELKQNAYLKSQLNNGMTTAEKGLALSYLVGRPINIDDNTGILYYVDRVERNGNMNIHYINGREFKTMSIPSNISFDLNDNGVVVFDYHTSEHRL